MNEINQVEKNIDNCETSKSKDFEGVNPSSEQNEAFELLADKPSNTETGFTADIDDIDKGKYDANPPLDNNNKNGENGDSPERTKDTPGQNDINNHDDWNL